MNPRPPRNLDGGHDAHFECETATRQGLLLQVYPGHYYSAPFPRSSVERIFWPLQSWIAFQLDTEPNQHGKSGVELVLTLVLTREVLGVHRSLGVRYGPKNRIYYTPVPNAHERS